MASLRKPELCNRKHSFGAGYSTQKAEPTSVTQKTTIMRKFCYDIDQV